MKKVFDSFLVDYTNGTREEYNTLEEFYNQYIKIKKSKKMKTVSRWCSVDSNCHISPLSEHGLYQLFLRAKEPQTNGFVLCQYINKEIYYKTDGACLTKDLKKALILNQSEAEREMRINKLYVKMIKCSIKERDIGKIDNK